MTCVSVHHADDMGELTVDLSDTVKAISEFDDTFTTLIRETIPSYTISEPDRIQMKVRRDTQNPMVYGEITAYREMYDDDLKHLGDVPIETFRKINDFLVDQFNEAMTEMSADTISKWKTENYLETMEVHVGFKLEGRGVSKEFYIYPKQFMEAMKGKEVYFL